MIKIIVKKGKNNIYFLAIKQNKNNLENHNLLIESIYLIIY